MAEKNFSCIKKVVKTVQVALPATFICNEIFGSKEILDSWKRQYSKDLKGVVVNYKLYSILEAAGFTTVNKPYVLYNVKAAFDLFCPKVGDIVKAKINRISKEHIVLLIEDTINVTIHLPKDSPKDLAPFIYLNGEILFEVSSFSFDQKMVLSVRGKITPKCIELMKELFPPQSFSNLVDIPELLNNTDEGIGTSSESADDGLLTHTFDCSKINDDVNFKKPFTSTTKSKKSSKRPKNDSESFSMDTSDVSTSDEKPKKKKKKYNDKFNPYVGNYLNVNNVSSDTVNSDTLIQNFSSFNHSEVLEALKEEELHFEDNIHAKKHKKKQRQDSSPSFILEPTKSNNQTLGNDISNLDINISTEVEVVKSSKKRKRESESSLIDISEQSLADKLPKKKCKDKTVPLEKEVKNELPDDATISATVLSIKREMSSPVKTIVNCVPESKVKNKSKGKKSEKKDKLKKKKIKVLASGAVLKKSKKPHKKDSKKSRLDGKQSKKHKKGKSHKKDKSDKKKKKDNSKKIPNVIKSEID